MGKLLRSGLGDIGEDVNLTDYLVLGRFPRPVSGSKLSSAIRDEDYADSGTQTSSRVRDRDSPCGIVAVYLTTKYK